MTSRKEYCERTAETLRGLAMAPRLPLVARVEIAHAAGVLSMVEDEEFTVVADSLARSVPVQMLRESLNEDNSVDDATVVANTISLLGQMSADMSEVLIRVDSALKEHQPGLTGCQTCHVPMPCPTRTALEG